MEVLAAPQREEVLRRLRAHEAELHELGVLSLQIFGSVARDEATPTSDVDCLVEFSKPIGLFGFSQIRLFLENLLKHPVDMGTQAALKEHLRQPALEDLVHVF
ncbi:nucleotidyltransferase family protein [Leptolyngbya cf. ectocarpi LEGE 11479]|uniref:Nucleotidyltransferase family protein n=2 Tax=Leptolyngbya ectocarpi TaxID=1202 RepID=A0A929FBQ8_LEPEC|nr:nucleotidyltransferase family protein [Leptolyngbya cf. ectocarpi LEGE 11479]